MVEDPWLTIVGLGEDGPAGLAPASRAALDAAEVVMGPERHLSLLPPGAAERVTWPVPFADGLPLLEGFRGRRTVALASGDPFWFGAGSVIAARLAPGEWRALPGPSTASLAGARLGWPLETVTCLGLHAAPLTRLVPHLAPGARLIVLVRDGAAVPALAEYLRSSGWGASRVWILEALGGPRERVTAATAGTLPAREVVHPVCVAIEVAGDGRTLPRVAGLPDDVFDSDGQMTKRPMRALTLSALAPRHGETLWDIGGGSGSVAVEWLLRDPSLSAVSVERRADRAARIGANAARLGVDRLRVVTGSAPGALAGLSPPQAVFVGGGMSDDLVAAVRGAAPEARIVANAVTLEGEATLTRLHERLGGELMRVALSQAAPIGALRGWRASFPVVQWSFAP